MTADLTAAPVLTAAEVHRRRVHWTQACSARHSRRQSGLARPVDADAPAAAGSGAPTRLGAPAGMGASACTQVAHPAPWPRSQPPVAPHCRPEQGYGPDCPHACSTCLKPPHCACGCGHHDHCSQRSGHDCGHCCGSHAAPATAICAVVPYYDCGSACQVECPWAGHIHTTMASTLAAAGAEGPSTHHCVGLHVKDPTREEGVPSLGTAHGERGCDCHMHGLTATSAPRHDAGCLGWP
mmetsp:Transcript_13559/g.41006  ORF Transcript_13559/g.41006 Transcript_13559/m.41006 type:complete len:238 (-) Transcript_13559:849-1562(-)